MKPANVMTAFDSQWSDSSGYDILHCDQVGNGNVIALHAATQCSLFDRKLSIFIIFEQTIAS